MYFENIFVVCALWLLLGLIVATAIGLWTLARHQHWRQKRRATEREYYQSTHDAQGGPMPPLGRGVCQVCSSVPPWVYHLDDGRRLCPDCLAKEGRRAQVPPPQPLPAQ